MITGVPVVVSDYANGFGRDLAVIIGILAIVCLVFTSRWFG